MPNFEVTVDITVWQVLGVVFEADNEVQARAAMQAWIKDDPGGILMDSMTIDEQIEIHSVSETPQAAEVVASDWL